MPDTQLCLRLEPTLAEKNALAATLTVFQEACLHAVRTGQMAHTTGNALIHRLCYQQLRTQYGLHANLAIRAIAEAARHLKQQPAQQVPRQAAFDPRIFRLDPDAATVSLATVAGRLRHVKLILTHEERLLLRAHPARHAMLREDEAHGYLLTVTLQVQRG